MSRQRITYYNPTLTHDNIITHVDKEQLQLSPPGPGFIVENKLVIPVTSASIHEKYPLIKSIRVQLKQKSAYEYGPSEKSLDIENPVFGYPFDRGISVYVTPNALKEEHEKAEFFDQVQKLISKVAGIDVKEDNWIPVIGSLYFHSVSAPSKLDYSAVLNTPLEPELLALEPSIVDWSYSDTGITVKQVYRETEPVSLSVTSGVTKEIGLFLLDPQITSPDDLVLSGIRIVLNENNEDEENLFKTMFHVKPRHRQVPDHPVKSVISPNGLHPILRTTFENGIPEPKDEDVQECKLYYYINLEKSLIFDKYQSIPEGAQLILSNGKTELEAPEYTVQEWGNEILFEFDNLTSNVIDFTLHSRYQKPQQKPEYTTVSNPLPQVFIACSVSDSHILETSPFDNKAEIGGNYELYFTPDSVFYDFPQSSDNGIVEVDIPHGTSTFKQVNAITSIVVLLGTALVLYKLLRVALNGKEEVKEKKNQ